MCGINGIVKFNGAHVDAEAIRAMNRAVQHRGPDDEGLFLDRHVGLGHLRLAILDLSAKGHQPMRYAHAGRAALLVYNGEIYNFLDLRAVLEAKGYAFSSQCDSEVVLAAYLEYDVACVHHFNGMFAFAIYDVERQVLFGARDRFGQKPFKYYLDGEQFVFSSELKAVLRSGISREVDFEALDDFLTLQYVPNPRTGFRNVHKLPHAHYFVLDIPSGVMRITRYFDLDYSTKQSLPEREWLTRIDDKLRTAVERRLIADVPLGVFLSGGVDSSVITAVMHGLTGDIRTFSAAFEERAFDESVHATAVARRFGTSHTEFKVKAGDLLAHIDDLVYQYEEPYADNSQLPMFILSKLTRQHVTVALSGDAGDENFGGYEKHRVHALVDRLKPFLSPLAGAVPLLERIRRSPRLDRLLILLRTLNDPIAIRHFNYTTFFDTAAKREFYTATFSERLAGGRRNTFQVILGDRQVDEIDKVLYLDFNSYLPDDINAKVDLASMRSGLEVRSPMLDYEFAGLTAQIPWQLKVDSRRGKKIFKTLARKYLPNEIIDRPKHGFGVPIANWLRNELRDYARKAILDERGLVLQMMKREKVAALLDGHLAGENNATRIWTLLVLNLWHRQYFLEHR